MRLARVMIVVAIGSLGLVGCGDMKDPVVDEATPEPMEVAVDERCQDVSPDLMERLAEGLDVDAELEHPRQVVSEERNGVTFIAAELVGDDVDDEAPIGVWAAIGEGGGAELASVGAVARYHSSWPDATRGDDPLTMTTDGAEEAQKCVEDAIE